MGATSGHFGHCIAVAQAIVDDQPDIAVAELLDRLRGLRGVVIEWESHDKEAPHLSRSGEGLRYC